MIRVFAGYDPREAIGFHVFLQSLLDNTNEQVSVTPLHGKQRDGTNAFTYARFLVPHLCNFEGWAIFLDGSDMLLRADIAELWAMRDETKAVQVVKHDYKTKHPRKYIGTRMAADNADYPCKNWSSVILWNCGHPANRSLRPDIVEELAGSYLHRFNWTVDIGSLPLEWNHLVGEYEPNPNAKLVHYTLGIPSFVYYSQDEFHKEWKSYLDDVHGGDQGALAYRRAA